MGKFLTAIAVAMLGLSVITSDAAAQTENKQQSEAIRKYMKENFGYPGMETSWYPHIVSISVQGKKVVANTKINRQGSAGKEAAKGICGALSGYVFSKENLALGIEHVQVLGTDGGVVVSRQGFSDRCDAR